MTQRWIVKAADELRYDSTLAADSELVMPLSSGVYRVRAILRWTAGATPDIKVGVNVTGSTILWAGGKIFSESTAAAPSERIGPFFPGNLSTLSARVIVASSYNTLFAHAWIDITLSVDGDGELAIVWAQNTTSAITPAAVLAGSCIVYDRTDDLPRLTLVHRETENLQLVNAAPTDDDTLQIELAPNTGYAIECCLIARSSGTFGRELLTRLVCTGNFDIAHVKLNFAPTSATSAFTSSTTFVPLLLQNQLTDAGAPELNFGSGADSTTGRGVQHFLGHIIMGESGGTLKVQVGRTGTNPGGSARLAAGSWLSAEELPPC